MVVFPKTTQELKELGIFIIVAIFMIVFIFAFISALLTPHIGQLPALAVGAIIDLGLIYVSPVKLKIMKQIKKWHKENQCNLIYLA